LQEEENKKIVKIQIVQQLQEMDEESLLDWVSRINEPKPESELYEINVFSEGITKREPSRYKFNGIVFEKIIEKIKLNFKNTNTTVSLNIDYSEWIPIVLSYFSSSSKIVKSNADICIFDSNTFMMMWNEIIDSRLQNKWLDTKFNLLFFLKKRFVKKALLNHLGDFKQMYILNGGKLPIHIKELLVDTKLPISTTFGTLRNGYVSYLNKGLDILTEFGHKVVEHGGELEMVFVTEYDTSTIYNKVRGRKDFPYYPVCLESTTDCTYPKEMNNYDLEILYQNYIKKRPFPYFKTVVDKISFYAGRFSDTIMVDHPAYGLIPMPSTTLKTVLESVRLFKSVLLLSDSQRDITVLLEIDDAERENLDISEEKLDDFIQKIIKTINGGLSQHLQIKSFKRVDSSSSVKFIKTRNNNIKSCLYS